MAADQSSLTANVSSSPPAMASDLVDMINRLTLAKTKLEKKLDINRECIIEAIEGKDRTVKITKWLQSCKECSEKSVSKNEGILFLTSRESVKAALEHWLELLANKNDEILTKARQYLDTKQTLSYFESFKSRTLNHITQKSCGIF